MMSDYNPYGPWVINPANEETTVHPMIEHPDYGWIEILDTFGNRIASLPHDYVDDARLIAAAPEMADETDRLRALNAELLEACKTVNAWFEEWYIYSESPRAGEAAMHDIVQAAIAKAEKDVS